MKCNPFYMLRIKNGIYSTDNTISYYRNKLPDDTFSFDSSNQKVQANLDEFGTIVVRIVLTGQTNHQGVACFLQ